MEVLRVDVRLGTRASAADLKQYDAVVVATGVEPRVPELDGISHPKVVAYPDAITGAVVIGRRVAVMGAGGIGVDVSHLLTHDEAALRDAHSVRSSGTDREDWFAHWGVGDPAVDRGGVKEKKPRVAAREVFLLQRKTSAIGKGLGKTSGWAHRAVLRDSEVRMIPAVRYRRIDDTGLHITVGEGADAADQVLDVDHVVVCTGQEPVRALYDELVAAGVDAHLVGGADVAAELDAKRAIEQGTRLAAAL
jgi:2,4-dienoyl-CoA reductase (NADPH2)